MADGFWGGFTKPQASEYVNIPAAKKYKIVDGKLVDENGVIVEGDPKAVEAYNKQVTAPAYTPYKELGWWDSVRNKPLSQWVSQQNAQYLAEPAFAQQRRDEAVQTAVALRKAAANTDKDIFVDDQSHNAIFTSDPEFQADPKGYLLKKWAQHQGPWDEQYGNTNAQAARVRQLGSPAALAETGHYDILNNLNKNRQLYDLGYGERAANTENAQLQNLLDTANYTRSNGLPFLRARGEAQELGLTYDINPQRHAAAAAAYNAQIPQNEIERIQAEARLRNPAILQNNAQMGDANRAFALSTGGLAPAEIPHAGLIPHMDANGNVTYSENRYTPIIMRSQMDAKMHALQQGDALNGAAAQLGKQAPIPSIGLGGITNSPARMPANIGGRMPVATSFVSPDEALGNRPAVHPVNNELHNKFQSVINNYTKDLPPADADKIRLRLSDAVMEEIVNYAQLTPENIGSSAFYESAKKTFERAMKNPDLAKKLNNIPEDVQIGILQEALRKAGLTR